MIEKKAADLQKADMLVAKDGQEYEVVDVVPGMGGPRYPYLILTRVSDGRRLEHDTAFDSYSTTYSVKN